MFKDIRQIGRKAFSLVLIMYMFKDIRPIVSPNFVLNIQIIKTKDQGDTFVVAGEYLNSYKQKIILWKINA